MASLIAKKKANQLYYYVVESARVDGKPRIVHQTYLGTAEKVAALVKDRTAPVPLEATTLDLGLPGALWLAAQQTGVFDLLQSLWPQPRSGPSPAHYLLLAAIHRICQPGPKTEVADWYNRTILRSLWDFPSERFSSQEFWDCFDRIPEEQLEQAQIRLVGVWKEKQLVSRRLLAYDTTNFYTYVASTNTRNELAQRGHNKQGRHNLRQVGLSYVMDGDNGLSLCHHVYPGNRADAEELPAGAVANGSFVGPQSDCSRFGHPGVGQRIGGLSQHAGVRKGGSGLDFGFALEPGARLSCETGAWNSCPLAAVHNPASGRRRRRCSCMAKSISAC